MTAKRNGRKFLTKLYPKLRSIGLVYGDSAIFAKREVYEKIKGFRDLPLFEDVDLYKRLNRKGDFVTINIRDSHIVAPF